MKNFIQLFLNIFGKRKTSDAHFGLRHEAEQLKKVVNPVSYHQTEQWKEYVIKLKNRLSIRIDQDLKSGNIRKAMDRYEGFIKRFPMEQDIHNKLGALYLQTGDRFRAGKNFYFKENPSAEEAECIRVFENTFGNDPIIILRKVLEKDGFKVSVLHTYGQNIIRQKLIEIRKKTGRMPKTLLGIENHLIKKGPDISGPL